MIALKATLLLFVVALVTGFVTGLVLGLIAGAKGLHWFLDRKVNEEQGD